MSDIPAGAPMTPNTTGSETEEGRRTRLSGPVTLMGYRATYRRAAPEILLCLILTACALIGFVIALAVGISADPPDLNQCGGLLADADACAGDDPTAAYIWALIFGSTVSVTFPLMLWRWPTEYRAPQGQPE